MSMQGKRLASTVVPRVTLRRDGTISGTCHPGATMGANEGIQLESILAPLALVEDAALTPISDLGKNFGLRPFFVSHGSGGRSSPRADRPPYRAEPAFSVSGAGVRHVAMGRDGWRYRDSLVAVGAANEQSPCLAGPGAVKFMPLALATRCWLSPPL